MRDPARQRALLLVWLLAPLAVLAGGTTNAFRVEVEAAAMADAIAPPMCRSTAPAFVTGIPGVALRSQGFAEPQADISIRGAPFSSSGLTLGGLSLRNPQTEHFQSDLPVPCDVFGPPQLLTGLDQFRASAGHPAGSVALGFATLEDLRRIEVGGGPNDLFANLRLTRSDALDDLLVVGEGAFVEAASIGHADGYADNYLNRWSGGAQAQFRGNGNQLDLLGAYGWRDFGARGFYGTSPSYPAAEQVDEWLAAATATLGRDNPDLPPNHVSWGWTQTDDSYWLDRSNHGLYANHTLSDTATLHGDTRQALTPGLDLDLRADADAEWLDGTHSGTISPAYTGLGTHAREHLSLAALPRWTVGEFTGTAGGSGEFFARDQAAWLPAAGIEWHPSATRRVALSYTEAVREPSYTELDYESPGSLGNNGLQRQHTRTLELAWRETHACAEGGVALFAEDGRNLVDWVRSTPGGRWVATNLDHVRTYGFLADAAVPITHTVAATFAYQALAKTCATDVYASRYVLDYPEQSIRLGVRVRLIDDLAFACWQECAVYAGNPDRDGTDVSLAASAELRWRFWPKEGVELAAGIVNPWDSSLEIYPGQPSAGPRVYASMKRTW